MNPYTLHQNKIITEIYNELGRGEEAQRSIAAWYELRDSFATPGDKPEERVRQLKQYAKDKIYSQVLGGDPEAARLYDQKEARGFTPTEGVSNLLESLRKVGVQVAIVSESSSLTSTFAITRFLHVYNLGHYFSDIITPVGGFDVEGRLVDSRFVGATKKSGTIYDVLKALLQERGVAPAEGAMVGDDPILDIENAKLRSFIGIQYTGVVDRGRSKVADYVIDAWSEFPSIFWP
ncbi:MAG: HAD family hydrolase [Thaumarchaeota archaeon]|nr:HAD family hydrolase [Nitrososphaerota archaeon]